jgi:hypothetical protein
LFVLSVVLIFLAIRESGTTGARREKVNSAQMNSCTPPGFYE